MDADMVVTHNIDHVFDCGTFCASMRDNHFNTGSAKQQHNNNNNKLSQTCIAAIIESTLIHLFIYSSPLSFSFMVISPNQTLFDNMLLDYASTPSYNAGEQGFTNSRYPDMLMMPMYTHDNNPPLQIERTPAFPDKQSRLPETYNGDIGIFYLGNGHWVDSKPFVLHFTMLFFKPWRWFEYVMFTLNWEWYDHVLIDQESAGISFLRMLIPVVAFCAGLSLIFNLFTPKLANIPVLRSVLHYWATFVNDLPWLYSLLWAIVNWILFFVIHGSALRLTPRIPIAHPFTSMTIYTLWFLCMGVLTIIVNARFHEVLGTLVPPSSGLDSAHYTNSFDRVTGLLKAMAVNVACALVMMVFQDPGPLKIVACTVLVLGLVLMMSILYYRLPMISFRVGQARLVSFHSLNDHELSNM
jgi:hypothetical protein